MLEIGNQRSPQMMAATTRRPRPMGMTNKEKHETFKKAMFANDDQSVALMEAAGVARSALINTSSEICTCSA